MTGPNKPVGTTSEPLKQGKSVFGGAHNSMGFCTKMTTYSVPTRLLAYKSLLGYLLSCSLYLVGTTCRHDILCHWSLPLSAPARYRWPQLEHTSDSPAAERCAKVRGCPWRWNK